MILTSLETSTQEFENRTGWKVTADGLCKGDVCVPLPGAAAGGTLNARTLSDRLGMPLIHDDDADIWCLGPEAMGRALTTAQAPELTLPDYRGHLFKLGALRGQKVLIVAWAPW